MYRTVAAGALLFVIYLYQNLLHTCNGQLADDNHDGSFQIVHAARRGIEGTLNEGLTDNDRLSCYLRIPAKSQPLDVRQIKNNGQRDFQVTWDDNSLTGNVQCLLEQDGKVIQRSNKLFIRSSRFFAVIRLNRNLTLQESQDIKYIKHFKDLQKLSAEPFVYHVQINVILLNAETDNSQLNIMRSNIKEYISSISIKMNIMSTKYCPPVPELNITVDDYRPGKVYTFGDNKLTCEGGFYKGVFWNENQIQESLRRLRLLEFQNSTLNTIDDVRNFSAALNANEFVHERELDVFADLFNQLQTSNVLSDMDSRKNTSNELIANSESKLIKMPLTSNVAEAVRETFAARVENISATQSTGIMFVDSDEKNVNQAFQNIVTLKKSTPIAEFFTPNTRLGIRIPESILGNNIHKISYTAYRKPNAMFGTGKRPMTSVVSATVDGGHQQNLKDPVIIFLRREPSDKKGCCVSWDFSAKNGVGDWSTDGCTLKATHNLGEMSFLDECHCFHMTHFGELLWNSNDSFYIDCAQQMKHEKTLDFVSEVSCVTSLVALTGVFLTAIVFPEWLKGAGQKITLQMAASLALLLTIFEVAINTKINENETGCVLLGFILHYALLSSFCWMAVAGYLQYHRLVTVLYSRTPKLVFKAAVIGWGVPIIPGAMVLITIQFQVYSGSQLCLPQGFAFYATILAPLTIILVFNAIVFRLIAKNLFRMFEAKAHVDKDVSIRRFKQLLFLFTLFGLNWFFGLLQIFNPALRVYFAYLFSISVALQGVAYFAFFVLMHDKVRKRLQALFSRKDGISDTSFILTDSSH